MNPLVSLATAWVIAIAGVVLPSMAQESGKPPAGAFRALSLEVDIPEIYFRDGQSYRPFSVRAFRPGSPIATDPKGDLEFFERVEGDPKAADGSAGYRPVASVPASSRFPRSLLIFEPEKPADSGPRSFRVRVFDDSTDAHPEQSVRLINLTDRTSSVASGQTSAVVPPGQNGRIAPALTAKHQSLVQVGLRDNGGWTLSHSERVALPPGTRHMYLHVYSPSGLAECIPEFERGNAPADPGYFVIGIRDQIAALPYLVGEPP